AIIGDDTSLIGGIIGAIALLVINYLTVRFMFHHPKLETLVEGEAVVLLENGAIKEDAMKREMISLPELQAAARKQGFENLNEIHEAVLESSGTISFCRKDPNPETIRYQEVLKRLDTISAELSRLAMKS